MSHRSGSSRSQRSSGSRALVTHSQANGLKNSSNTAMELYSSNNSQLSSVNEEEQLALRIEGETKSHNHLLRLLQEIDDENGNSSADPIGQSIASLMNEFRHEANVIEHRIKDEHLLMNGEQPPLPPDWIALEDPGSGDIYYANEVTGETTWDRPGLMTELQGRLEGMNFTDDYEGNLALSSSTLNNQYNSSNPALMDSENSALGRGNQYDGSGLSNSTEPYDPSMRTSSTSNNYGDSGQNNGSSMSNDRFDPNGSSMSNTLNESAISNTLNESALSNTLSESVQDMDQLPPNWIALADPNSGDTYWANEVTGESTWEKPTMTPEEKSAVQSTMSDKSKDIDDLPPDWVALEDSDSGDTYYLNQVTMETTWDRPTREVDDKSGASGLSNAVSAASQQPSMASQESSVVSRQVSDAPDNEGELPPGWEAIFDDATGDTYYAHINGDTQWERPESGEDEIEHDQQQALVTLPQSPEDNELSGNHQQSPQEDGDEGLPEGWYTCVDPDSGDSYYVNEATQETSWDRPGGGGDSPAATGDQGNPIIEVPNMEKTNESESEMTHGDLPPGWEASKDPYTVFFSRTQKSSHVHFAQFLMKVLVIIIMLMRQRKRPPGTDQQWNMQHLMLPPTTAKEAHPRLTFPRAGLAQLTRRLERNTSVMKTLVKQLGTIRPPPLRIRPSLKSAELRILLLQMKKRWMIRFLLAGFQVRRVALVYRFDPIKTLNSRNSFKFPIRPRARLTSSMNKHRRRPGRGPNSILVEA